MKCPLLLAGTANPASHISLEESNCLKEECAWWNRTAKKCAVLQLVFEIDEVHDHLERIHDKMRK